MYGCENWTIKKAEHLRIVAFELWCCRILLRVPWTSRRSNQSILKEISPEYSLEGLMLKLQYLGHLVWRVNSLEKTLMLGKIEGRKRRGRQDEMVGWHHRLNGYEFEQTQETVKDRGAWRASVHGVTKGQTQLSNWRTTTIQIAYQILAVYSEHGLHWILMGNINHYRLCQLSPSP